MRVLVTGSSGFVGKHLLHELLQHGHAPLAFDLAPDRSLPASVPGFAGDVLNAEELARLVARLRPEACIHLSGISFVPASWQNPAQTLAVNLLGAAHLLEAFRQAAVPARILVISSAQIYGAQPRERPLTEDDLPHPDSPYAVSKAAADQLTLLYARRHGLHAMTVRPTNHIGPGQSTQFVVPALTEQLLAIARHQAPPVVKVGNLENRRDFIDVRDVVRGYRLLIESGRGGQAYNLASGQEISIREILDQLCRIVGVNPQVATDPGRFRATESQPRLASAKIASELHWKPEIPMAATLRDVVHLAGSAAAG